MVDKNLLDLVGALSTASTSNDTATSQRLKPERRIAKCKIVPFDHAGFAPIPRYYECGTSQAI